MEADSAGSGVDDRVLDTCFVLRFLDDVVVVVDGIGVEDAFGTCGDDSFINSFDGVESRDELSLLLELMLSTFFPLTDAVKCQKKLSVMDRRRLFFLKNCYVYENVFDIQKQFVNAVESGRFYTMASENPNS